MADLIDTLSRSPRVVLTHGGVDESDYAVVRSRTIDWREKLEELGLVVTVVGDPSEPKTVAEAHKLMDAVYDEVLKGACVLLVGTCEEEDILMVLGDRKCGCPSCRGRRKNDWKASRKEWGL